MSSTAFLNFFLSNTQNPQSPIAYTDADRGAWYIKANSPKNAGVFNTLLTSSFMIILQSPLSYLLMMIIYQL